MNVNLLLDVQLGDPTGSEPVTVAQVKSQLKIDFTTDDALIAALIPAARAQIEQFTGISLVNRSVAIVAKLTGDNWFELPYGPVDKSSVVVSTVGIGGATIDPIPTTGYDLIGTKFVSINTRSFTGSFNTNDGYDTCYPIAAVYDAGYLTLPENLTEAVLNQVAYLYEHRGDESEINGMSPTAVSLAKVSRRVVI